MIQYLLQKQVEILNLQSDARYRFERGVDFTSIDWGVEAATKMIIDLCGGEASETCFKSKLKNKQKN